MANFFSSISNFFIAIGDYFVGLLSSITGFFSIINEASFTFGRMVGFLPSIIQISGMAVISIAIFKAIFGRQGSS